MGKKLASFFLEILQVVVFAISIFLFIYLLVMQPHKIKGDSMEPNFHNAEYLLTDKVSYRFKDPQRGDVVVFKAPPDFKEEYIKRIIGLPGDEILIKDGIVFVNNSPLNEPYIPEDFYNTTGRFITEGETKIVPDGQYFVMGDNREHSFDSRNLGFIEFNKITGRAWVIYWPPSKAGTVKRPTY